MLALWKKINFKNRGNTKKRGVWQVDHYPVPYRDIESQILIGITNTNDPSNLVPSCMECNLSHKFEILRSRTESKNKAIDVLDTKINKIKSILESSNEIKLYRLTIRKVTKEEKEEHKSSSVDMIGGILVIIIDEIVLTIKDNKIKLKSKDYSFNNSNRIFIDNKYLKKYNKINDSLIKKISFKYYINKIDGGFTINKISHFV